MVSLNDYKTRLLIDENNTEQDKILKHLLKRANEFINVYIYPNKYIDELDYIVENIAVKMYNRIKDEGILTKSTGFNITYSNSLLTLEEKSLLDKYKDNSGNNRTVYFMSTGDLND